MAKSKYLDLTGLSKFKDKIVSLIVNHASDNNIHTSKEEKEKISTAYSHSTSVHAPTDAEKNIIVGVQKNGSDLSVNNSTRKVNITVPTKVSDLTNDSGYLTEHQDISGKLDKNQGVSNSGKIAGINESGDIVPMFPQGVTYNEDTQCLEYGADEKLNLNVGIQLDDTLSKVGYAADASKVGELKSDLGGLDDNINRQTIFSKNTMLHTITNIVIDNYTYPSNFKKGEEYEVIVSCNSTSTKQICFLNSNMGTPYVVADEVTNKVWENYVYRVIMPDDSSGLMIYVGEQGASISVTVNYIVNVKNTLGNPTMINKSTNEVGAINESGILESVDGYISTDFINVKGGCDYNIFATLLTMYNDGKEYIGRSMYLKGVYTLDSNVSYVRLTETSDKSDKMLFQLNVFDRIRNIEDTLINDSISFDKNSLPFVNINVNDFDTMTKDNKIKGILSFTVDNEIKFILPIKIGWQGSGSLEYPKKNFSITLYKDMGYKKKANLKINDWYGTSGYHLKANYYDHSMVRNCVATQLAKTVCGNNEPNGAMCYVESFPFILLVNGTFYGCYTWNLKQDNDLFMMDKTNPNHIIYRNNSTTSIVDFDNWEFRGDADESDEMKSKLQSLINWCVNSTDEDFVANLGNKFNLTSLFGYILFAEYGMCADSLSNNWTIATWDGNIWYNIYYDLDICFGMNYLGGDGSLENMEQYQVNTFFKRVTSLFTSEINSYYSQLRKLGVLDIDYVYNKFFEYKSMFGMPNLIAEYEMWQSRPNSDLDIDILKNWLRNKLHYMDLKYGYSTN